jgi:hypothetical protein
VPTFANNDSSSAVVEEHLVVRVLTAREHVRPSSVFGCLLSGRGLPMLPAGSSEFSTKLNAKTSARTGHPSAENSPTDNLLIAASASANERNDASLSFLGYSENCPTAKLLSREINLHHPSGIVGFGQKV